MKNKLNNQNAVSEKGKEILFCVTSLNQGNNRNTINEAPKNAMITTNNDSPKNCLINWLRTEPTAFLMPTSLALFSERAVLRFIKLIQASNNTKIPMMPNSQ